MTSPGKGHAFDPELFAVGERVRVREAFSSGGDSFVMSEYLQFVGAYYSRYDSSSVYRFRRANGEMVEWWLHELSDPSVADRLFVREGAEKRGG
ncbi:MAG: hypothetical protein U0234_26295 [Sandaracinus sp.]